MNSLALQNNVMPTNYWIISDYSFDFTCNFPLALSILLHCWEIDTNIRCFRFILYR